MHGSIIEILAYAVGIIGASGGVVGYFGKSRGDSIIKYQANEIQLRDGTIARLEKEATSVLTENKLLKEQNSKLWDKAQGSPQLKTLTKAVEALTTTINKTLKKDGNERTE